MYLVPDSYRQSLSAESTTFTVYYYLHIFLTCFCGGCMFLRMWGCVQEKKYRKRSHTTAFLDSYRDTDDLPVFRSKHLKIHTEGIDDGRGGYTGRKVPSLQDMCAREIIRREPFTEYRDTYWYMKKLPVPQLIRTAINRSQVAMTHYWSQAARQINVELESCRFCTPDDEDERAVIKQTQELRNIRHKNAYWYCISKESKFVQKCQTAVSFLVGVADTSGWKGNRKHIVSKNPGSCSNQQLLDKINLFDRRMCARLHHRIAVPINKWCMCDTDRELISDPINGKCICNIEPENRVTFVLENCTTMRSIDMRWVVEAIKTLPPDESRINLMEYLELKQEHLWIWACNSWCSVISCDDDDETISDFGGSSSSGGGGEEEDINISSSSDSDNT